MKLVPCLFVVALFLICTIFFTNSNDIFDDIGWHRNSEAITEVFFDTISFQPVKLFVTHASVTSVVYRYSNKKGSLCMKWEFFLIDQFVTFKVLPSSLLLVYSGIF